MSIMMPSLAPPILVFVVLPELTMKVAKVAETRSVDVKPTQFSATAMAMPPSCPVFRMLLANLAPES